MKFTALALLPSAFVTVLAWWAKPDVPHWQPSTAEAFSITGLWLITWCVIALYWVGRIWRIATRGRRPY